jgi:hypothetical protein
MAIQTLRMPANEIILAVRAYDAVIHSASPIIQPRCGTPILRRFSAVHNAKCGGGCPNCSFIDKVKGAGA